MFAPLSLQATIKTQFSTHLMFDFLCFQIRLFLDDFWSPFVWRTDSLLIKLNSLLSCLLSPSLNLFVEECIVLLRNVQPFCLPPGIVRNVSSWRVCFKAICELNSCQVFMMKIPVTLSRNNDIR